MAEARIDVAWRFVQKHALRAQVFGVVDRLSVVLTERGRHIQLYHVLMIFSYRKLQRTHQPRHLDYSSRLRSWAAEEVETWSVADAPLLIVETRDVQCRRNACCGFDIRNGKVPAIRKVCIFIETRSPSKRGPVYFLHKTVIHRSLIIGGDRHCRKRRI